MTEFVAVNVLSGRAGREAELEREIRTLVTAEFAAARLHGAISFDLVHEESKGGAG